MTELPSARAINSRWRHLVVVCKPLVFGALLVAPIWYAVHRCTAPEPLPELSARGYVDHTDDDASRQKVRPYLAKLHDKARAHMRAANAANPRGLDPLLEILLERVDYQVLLRSERQVDRRSIEHAFRHLGEDVGDLLVQDLTDDDRCATAMTRVFEEATGSDVIQVVPRNTGPRGGLQPVLRVRWSIRPGSSEAPNTILAEGTATLVLWNKQGPLEISEPFTLSRAVDRSGSASGAIDDLCTRIGTHLVERLTSKHEGHAASLER